MHDFRISTADVGKVEYEYSHADGRDDDVQISLGVLKDQTNYNGSVDCYKSMWYLAYISFRYAGSVDAFRMAS